MESHDATRPAPALTYAKRPRFALSRGPLRPGRWGFVVVVAAAVAAAGWASWAWRLRADRAAFAACATVDPNGNLVRFHAPPTRAALRHVARLPGRWGVYLNWAAATDAAALEPFRAVRLANVRSLQLGASVPADVVVREVARPDTGLGSLDALFLFNTGLTDEGVRCLARPDTGLKGLTTLKLGDTRVTDAGLRDLARPGSPLAGLSDLDLVDLPVTDQGLAAIGGPDAGLPSLKVLALNWTRATEPAVRALRQARPGLTVYY